MNVLTRPGVTAPVDVDWVSGASMMVRRDAFVAVSGMDEGFFLYWEDADYCARVAAAGFRRVYVPSASIRHLGGRSADYQPGPAIRAFPRKQDQPPTALLDAAVQNKQQRSNMNNVLGTYS